MNNPINDAFTLWLPWALSIHEPRHPGNLEYIDTHRFRTRPSHVRACLDERVPSIRYYIHDAAVIGNSTTYPDEAWYSFLQGRYEIR